SRLRSDRTLPVFFQRKGRRGSGGPAVGFGGGCFRFARCCCCTAVWFALMLLGRLLIVGQSERLRVGSWFR
uniref:Uncharacterized protein n=1 Tax=Aegilops tauschii subsp. strangulata TaxID=200361 RepID=A0A453PX33_AEGTS